MVVTSIRQKCGSCGQQALMLVQDNPGLNSPIIADCEDCGRRHEQVNGVFKPKPLPPPLMKAQAA